MDLVAADHGEVHGDQLNLVWFIDPQRFQQSVGEVGEFGVFYELRGFWIKLLPDFVEHFKIVFSQRLCALLCGHAEVLQDNGDVHVDHDEKGNDDVRDKKSDAHRGVSTVTFDGGASVGDGGVALLRRIIKYGAEQPVPPSRGGDLKQAQHAVSKRLKVEHVVYP